jgi:DtxR family Mn-dependent transcriptional regulator
MEKLLGNPKFAPHGAPIPDKSGKMPKNSYIKLSECKAGETVKLAEVINASCEFLKFLNSREINIGLKIKVKSVEPFDGTILVSYGNRTTEALSHTVCERLLVEKEK